MTQPNLQPNAFNGGKWNRFATDKETKRALNSKDAEVIEIPVIQMTYVISHKYGIMVRCGMMGGDTFAVEVAWHYNNDLAMRADKEELRTLARIPV